MFIDAGTMKRVFVNRHVLSANKAKGTDEPALTVHNRGKTYPCRRVEIEGPCTVHQDPDGNPSCRDSTVWIETRSPLTTIR